MTKKQVGSLALLIIIFLALSIAFFLLGTFPRHILEDFIDYSNLSNSVAIKTAINIVFWTASTLIIAVTLNCNEFSSVIQKISQLKSKLFILFMLQVAMDVLSWFVVYLDNSATFIYVYKTVSIMVNWLLMFHFLAPKRVNTSKRSKYKNMFLVICVVVTLVFVIIDFVNITEYQQINSSIDFDFSASSSNNNYFNLIANSLSNSVSLSKTCELLNLILDFVISITFFITYSLSKFRKN